MISSRADDQLVPAAEVVGESDLSSLRRAASSRLVPSECSRSSRSAAPRSEPTISRHVKIRDNAVALNTDKRGPWVWYSVILERIDGLRHLLSSTAA